MPGWSIGPLARLSVSVRLDPSSFALASLRYDNCREIQCPMFRSRRRMRLRARREIGTSGPPSVMSLLIWQRVGRRWYSEKLSSQHIDKVQIWLLCGLQTSFHAVIGHSADVQDFPPVTGLLWQHDSIFSRALAPGRPRANQLRMPFRRRAPLSFGRTAPNRVGRLRGALPPLHLHWGSFRHLRTPYFPGAASEAPVTGRR